MGIRYSEFNKSVGANLQQQRKKAGFKSAVMFAKHMGINPSTYTDYEQGKASLSYERAWQFANVLGCTLDQIGGRTPPSVTYIDPKQKALNGYFESMNCASQDTLVEAARLMSGSPATRIEKDRQETVLLQIAMGT